jgi:hypothetical protein
MYSCMMKKPYPFAGSFCANNSTGICIVPQQILARSFHKI